jgi:hypothetical protein
MDKYIIDSDIDFYKELLNDDCEFAVDNSCCILTGLPLTRNYIILDCSHTFNYLMKSVLKNNTMSIMWII